MSWVKVFPAKALLFFLFVPSFIAVPFFSTWMKAVDSNAWLELSALRLAFYIGLNRSLTLAYSKVAQNLKEHI